MTGHPEPATDRAWSWVEHLRGGGRTPWAEWTAPQAPSAPGPVPDRLPGAAQLEVVRRLADRHEPGTLDFPALADLVLGRSGPGRGPGEIPLPDGGDRPDGPRFGTPALDPAEVPVGELIRVGVGALCDLLVSHDRPAPVVARPRRRPWSRRFVLAGPPVSTASLRAALADAGHVEGGRRPRVLLVARPLEDMLQEVWAARTQRGAVIRWAKLVDRWAGQDRLPVSADLPLLAAHWAERVGPDRVHLLAVPDDGGDVRRTAAEVLGVPIPEPPEPGAADVLPVPPQGVDVLRRLNTVLNVRVDPVRHGALVRKAAAHLRGADRPLAVPGRWTAWVRERAERMVGELQAGGYAVHGDLQQIAARRSGGLDSVPRADVLDIALEACLRAAAGQRRGEVRRS